MKEKGRGQKTKLYRYYVAVGLIAVLAAGGVHLGTFLYAHRPLQRLERPETGAKDQEISLYVKNGNQKLPFTAHIGARKRTQEELDTVFSQAEAELSGGLKGGNTSLLAVTGALHMPATAADGAVQVSWSSDAPEIISYDGTLAEEIPENGVYVDLEATMSCEDAVAYYTPRVFVLPKKDSSLQGQLTAAVQAANADGTKRWYVLPDTLGEQSLLWYRKVADPALLVAGIVLALGFFLPQHRKEQQRQARQKEKARLLQMYPTLVSQMVLYMGAGMSISQTFRQIAGGKKGRQPGVLEQVCQTFVRELAQGIPEQDALHRLGERSGLWEYKAFCGLLIQNRTRGNENLLPMLQTEAQKAFAERQRRARILGNEAGTKLLLPMMLMLVVVLLLVLFPAVTSFYT